MLSATFHVGRKPRLLIGRYDDSRILKPAQRFEVTLAPAFLRGIIRPVPA
jgi:hypothetical protein